MKKVSMILADGFEEMEAICTIDILRRAGVRVDIIGLNDTTITGSHDITLIADEKFDYYGVLDYDGIVFAGGMKNAMTLSENHDVLNLINHYNELGKLIAGICATPAIVFSKTNILDGKNATCYPDEELISKLKNANYVDKCAVVCDNIITSQSPYTAMAFGISITSYLGLDVDALQLALKGN